MTTVTKPAVKALAMAIAAALCAQLAYAVTPTAVWDCAVSGQELNTTQGGLTISAGGGGSTFVNGAVRIGNSSGGYSGASIVLPSNLSKASVLIKYSNFVGFSDHAMYNNNDFYAPIFMSVEDSDGNVLGIGATNNAANLSWSWRTANGYHNNVLTRHFAEGPVLPATSGYALFSYDAAVGMRICLGTSLDSLSTSENTGYHFSGRTLKNIGLGGESGYQYADGWPNLVIEKVALFTGQYLSATDVADYEFPSEVGMFRSDVTVTEINDAFGSESEITVRLADGVTVTGDTTFNASTVHFICDGSFNMTPPANNEAVFDFSGVTGRPVLIYSALPAVSGTKFTSTVIPSFVTDPAQWTGTIYISSATVTDFTSNTYGNESSVVRLGNVSGYLNAPGNYAFTNTVPVELVGTLTINNGSSANDGNPNKCTVFKKLSGSGWISTDSTAAGVVIVIQDASEFTGSLGLSSGKYIVFGETMPDYTTAIKNTTVGTIFVMSGAKVTNRGFWWATGGIKVDGELCAPNHADYFGGGTTITTSDTGVFTLTSTGNGVETETDTSYARITGTGALKYEGAGWRALSATDFPTNMTLINEQAGDLLLSRAQTYTIGSLAGSKNFQGNYGNGDRYLRVLQAKDTEWSGIIVYDYYDRFKGLIVAPGVSTNGTLTLSGTQIQSRTLTVESGAKVNLTGTWVGATTVNGTLSGTGTVDGPLTLADGSTLIANTADPLTVSSLSLPSTGTVTISLADSDIGKDFIISSSAIDTTDKKFAFTVNGEPRNLTVIKTAGGLKAVLPGMKIIFR